jgi:hypothetical protein
LSAYRDKLLSIGVISGKSRPREYRDGGERVKQVTDEHGNVLTWRGSNDAPGVEIRPKTITMADGRVLTHHEEA